MAGSALDNGRAYNSSNAYMRLRYSSVSDPMHHISLRQGLSWNDGARIHEPPYLQ